MKNKIYLLCYVVCHCTVISAWNNMSTIVNEYELGAWAFKQHNNICEKIHPAISNGSITPYTFDLKTINIKAALRAFETSYVAFVSTDVDDPTKGYDTTVWTPLSKNFYGFMVSDKYIQVLVNKTGKFIQFDKTQLYKLLSEENLAYIQKYAVDNHILCEDIPIISHNIIIDVNLRLKKESKKPESELFKTDSLLSNYNPDEKYYRGLSEVIIFMATDPDDPTIGRDSVYYKDIEIADTSVYQGLFFALKTVHLNMTISGISCGFHPSFGGVVMTDPVPLGFLKYEKTSFLSNFEKNLLEYCLLFCIKDKLEPHYRYEYNAYLETFKITAKG